MTKMTPRQIKIIEKLGEALQKEVDDLSLSAAKGIIHFGLDSACQELGIELAAVQEYDANGKIGFMTLLMDKTGERLIRHRIPDGRIESIKSNLMETYKQIM